MDDFLRFLDLSPTVFHAAKNIEEALTKAHFTLLKEDEKADKNSNHNSKMQESVNEWRTERFCFLSPPTLTPSPS